METDTKTLAFGRAVLAELMQKAALKGFVMARETKREAMRTECAKTREARLWQVKCKKAIAEINSEPFSPPKPKPTEAKRKAAHSEAAKNASGEPVTKRPPRKLLAHLPEEERARILSERAKKAAATRAAKKAIAASATSSDYDSDHYEMDADEVAYWAKWDAEQEAKHAAKASDPLGLFNNEPCPPSPSSFVASELEGLFPTLPEGMTFEMYDAL